jgi:hypothetical protein
LSAHSFSGVEIEGCESLILPAISPIQILLSDIRHFVHQPRPELRPFIREIIWNSSDHPRAQMLLPEITLTLVLLQSGQLSLN